jgi:hypothetical protein
MCDIPGTITSDSTICPNGAVAGAAASSSICCLTIAGTLNQNLWYFFSLS